MTIQWSVLLWTIINFVVLMVCLNRILFQPILNLMDARKEKTVALQKREEERQERLAALEKEAHLRRVELERVQQENFVRTMENEKKHVLEEENWAREEQKQKIAAYQEELKTKRDFYEAVMEENAHIMAEKVVNQLENA